MILRSAFLLLLLTVPALAEDDHDRAHSALAQGAILPLSAILPGLESQYGARLLSVELDEEHDRLVYEFELITPRGQIVDVNVDAATGAVITTEPGHHDEDDD
ncbi:PepSY domain-containing protein [Rhodobacter capsulatus]|uniref:PepSY domain-containing protein n=1 Tax=Rhodobacter capsulatus TaxID=1061 RepID=UPI0040286395